ncbi:unnamed protein product [Boreogadus saida]
MLRQKQKHLSAISEDIHLCTPHYRVQTQCPAAPLGLQGPSRAPQGPLQAPAPASNHLIYFSSCTGVLCSGLLTHLAPLVRQPRSAPHPLGPDTFSNNTYSGFGPETETEKD